MKYVIMTLTVLMTVTAIAQEVPDYMKDGTITVTLKNGKQYTFSTNEYKVVSRKSSSLKLDLAEKQIMELKGEVARQSQEPKRLKHILSGEVVHSNRGLNTKERANEVDVSSRKQIGVGVQYQYNFHGDLYMGGRIDSNGGTGVNLGVGF